MDIRHLLSLFLTSHNACTVCGSLKISIISEIKLFVGDRGWAGIGNTRYWNHQSKFGLCRVVPSSSENLISKVSPTTT